MSNVNTLSYSPGAPSPVQGILAQTGALFLDAYRDLNARKMFWFVLALSAVAIIIFGLLGADENHFSIPGKTFEVEGAKTIYKGLFTTFVFSVWLTWVATILALISTAGIFPDFIASGAIDLYLSKPISRWRLFLTKYISALLFMTLQVTVFSLGAFLIFGIRIGEWKPAIFLAIPIVVAFFSYLYCICTLFGVLTRSTITALLLTILVWAALALLNTVDTGFGCIPGTLQARNVTAAQVAIADAVLPSLDARIAAMPETAPATGTAPATAADTAPAKRFDELRPEEMNRQQLQDLRDAIAKRRENARSIRDICDSINKVVYAIKTPLPKTKETVNLLDRYVFSEEEAKAQVARAGRENELRELRASKNLSRNEEERLSNLEGQIKTIEESYNRSIWWILGNSLLFEAVIVGLAGWIFCKRDY